MKKLISFLVFANILFLLYTLGTAEVPPMINYQGKMTTATGALIVDTTVTMEFKIYDDSTLGNVLWQETQSNVKVELGIFNVLLGSVTPISGSVFDGNIRYLGVKVGDDPELTPRRRIASVGYALHSGTADTAYVSMPDADWTINGDNIYHMNGNVGIGTTSPQAKLDVYGLVNASAYKGTEFVRLINGASDYRWEAHSSGVYYLYNQNTGGYPIFVHPSDNVGIGTQSPRSKLDVSGTASCQNSLRIYGDLVNYHEIRHNGITGNLEIDPIGSLNLIVPDGNVGIGTTSPAYKLDVAGDIRFANFYGNSGTLNGSLIVNGPGGSINSITSNTNGSYAGVAGLNVGTGPGIYAESYSTQSTTGGVTGKAKADGGSGVYGETWSAGVIGGSSVAVFGWAPATGEGVGGAALGVLGKVGSYQKPNPPYSSVPAGVFGWATATSGVNAGVYGQTDSPDGFGVYSKGKLEVNGSINTNGTITAGSGSSRLGVGTYNPSYRIQVGEGAYCNGTNWVNASSRKYKKDISSFTSEEYQDILQKLTKTEVVRFHYKSENDSKLHIGVVAEDAPEEMVDVERTGIPTGDAIGFLLAAIKAQQEEIETLKAKLEKLESSH